MSSEPQRKALHECHLLMAHFGWKEVDFQTETLEIAPAFPIRICGVAAENSGGAVVSGSAGSISGDPENRACWELMEHILLKEVLERSERETFELTRRSARDGRSLGILKSSHLFPLSTAPEQWQYAKTNGVALHDSWHEACLTAAKELIERNLIMNSWLGITQHKIIALAERNRFSALNDLYETVHVDFGTQIAMNFDRALHVTGTFLFPKNLANPLVFGFGSGTTADNALGKAMDEAAQRLGFLWGIEIPNQLPDFSPSSAFHQDYFLMPQNHALIRNWLNGAHAKTQGSLAPPIAFDFVDLTPANTPIDMKLVRAISRSVAPLTFGYCRENGFEDLPEDRLIHPIV